MNRKKKNTKIPLPVDKLFRKLEVGPITRLFEGILDYVSRLFTRTGVTPVTFTNARFALSMNSLKAMKAGHQFVEDDVWWRKTVVAQF